MAAGRAGRSGRDPAECGTRMPRLIDDLLDLTRVTRGKLQLNLEVVDVHQLIWHVHEICCAEIRAKHITVDFGLSGGGTFCGGGCGMRLHQMIWNLLKNVGKFTPEGGGSRSALRIRRGWKRLEAAIGAGGDSSVLRKATGVGTGINPEQISKLFNAFEQGDDITRQFGGLGLGLGDHEVLADGAPVRGVMVPHSDGVGKGAAFTADVCDGGGAGEVERTSGAPGNRAAAGAVDSAGGGSHGILHG